MKKIITLIIVAFLLSFNSSFGKNWCHVQWHVGSSVFVATFMTVTVDTLISRGDSLVFSVGDYVSTYCACTPYPGYPQWIHNSDTVVGQFQYTVRDTGNYTFYFAETAGGSECIYDVTS